MRWSGTSAPETGRAAAGRATRRLVRLKTAGAAYLEPLRIVAREGPPRVRLIGDVVREHYAEDRASYHVSAELSRVPELAGLPDDRLPGLLEEFDAREVLHVAFGSGLKEFGPRLLAALRAHADAYAETLERHRELFA